MTIIDRIHNMLIAMPYGLERMIELMDIEECESILTACVPIGGKPKILINPQFVREKCETDEKLFMLIQHELHHVLLGHTRLFKRVTSAHNIAFDAIINAMLCRSQPSPKWTALFTDSYSNQVFPWCLLRPPKNFPNEPIFPENIPDNIQDIIVKLYYSTDGTFLEIFELIPQVITEVGCDGVLEELLGNHGEDTRGIESIDDPELFETIRDVVERWPQPLQPLMGRSLEDFLGTAEVATVASDAQIIGKIIQAIIRSANEPGDIVGRFTRFDQQLVQQFFPSRDRRAFAMQQFSRLLPIYTANIPKVYWSQNSVTVYLDVSGSMDEYIPLLFNAIRIVQRKISVDIMAFSTQVWPISMSDLGDGVYQTTGGTDAECIWQHIIENEVPSAVLVTDGYVGKIPQKYLSLKRRVNIQCLLTANGWSSDVEPIVRRTEVMNVV